MGAVLVVDAANVVGSRPDGWWRDRPGAARRLHERLRAADLGRVVLVVEGAARAGVDEGEADGLRVVHAAGSGDDTIVDVVAAHTADASDASDAAHAADAVTVVTGDRELRRRVAELGAAFVGASWLQDQLPD